MLEIVVAFIYFAIGSVCLGIMDSAVDEVKPPRSVVITARVTTFLFWPVLLVVFAIWDAYERITR